MLEGWVFAYLKADQDAFLVSTRHQQLWICPRFSWREQHLLSKIISALVTKGHCYLEHQR